MKDMNRALSSAVAMILISALSCGDPTQVLEPIMVITPSSETVWDHYSTGNLIEWAGGNTDDILVLIMKNGTVVDTIASSYENTHSLVVPGYTLPSWGEGTDYCIRITDQFGEVGTSSDFTIQSITGEEVFSVSSPTSSSVWYWLDTDHTITWTTGYDKGNATQDEISIELWKGGSFVASISSSITNLGTYTLPDSISSEWGTGTNYRIKIVDNRSNFGFSANFTIEEPSEEEIINVTYPNASTVWATGEVNTLVTWDYPFPMYYKDRSRTDSQYQHGMDSVVIEILENGVKIGDICGWIPNTLSYTREEPLPSDWGSGSGYQIRVTDSNGNYGLSQAFGMIGLTRYEDQFNRPDGSNWDTPDIGGQYFIVGGYPSITIDNYSGRMSNTFSSTAQVQSDFCSVLDDYEFVFSWMYSNLTTTNTGICLYNNTHRVLGIRQNYDNGKVEFYNGNDWLFVEYRQENSWKDYRIEVIDTTANVYVNGVLKQSSIVTPSTVNNVRYIAWGRDFLRSITFYDNVSVIMEE